MPRLNLYPYQQEAVDFLKRLRGRGALFMKMRTGKTRAVLAYLKGRSHLNLIVCPKSVAYVWRSEIRLVNPKAKIAILVDLSTQQMVDKINRAAKVGGEVYLIINWETYWRYPAEDRKVKGKRKSMALRGVRKAILRFAPDTLVWDEAQRLKNRNTMQARFAHILEALPSVERAIPLTGTAVTEGIEDLFSIYKAFRKDVFGSNYGDFDRRYVTRGGYRGHEITGYKNQNEIRRKVDATAFQYEGAPDDIDDVIVPIELAPKTRAVYNKMKKDALAEIEGLDENGKPLRGIALARIVLTNILRLQQMTGGFVRTDNGDIDIGNEKLRTAVELTNDALDNGRRVVIFCRFLHDMKRLKKLLPHAGEIYGDINAAQRFAEQEKLRTGERKVLLVQIATGSLGIDLSGASVEIFYSVGYSLSEFLQARARLLGPKQSSSVTSYLLQAEDSIDEVVYEALQAKRDIAKRVTRLTYAFGIIDPKARPKRRGRRRAA